MPLPTSSSSLELESLPLDEPSSSAAAVWGSWKALIVPFHTAVRADYLQHQKEVDDLKRRLRSAEKNLHALMGAIKQVRRTCPCERHTYRPRLDTEPAIVAVMPPTVDANSISDGRTHPFTNVQAYRPLSLASAASCSPATPVSRPRIYITDYFKKK